MSAQKKLDFSETVMVLKLVKVVFLCYMFGFEKLSFNFSLLEVVDSKTRLLWYLWYLGWFFSYLPETLPCFLFFLVVILDVLLGNETITVLAGESICANVRSRVKVRFKQKFCERLKNVLEEKKLLKPFYHLPWDSIEGIERVAFTITNFCGFFCVIKQNKFFFQQVNLLFHQFPQDHLHPFQLLLHLLTWASQKRVTRIKIERYPPPLGQKDLLEFDREDLSLLHP